MQTLTMTLNGEEVTVQVKPSALLVEVLRDQLELTGTKVACGEGECGACTVLLDGVPVNSCLVPALKAQGREVMTVEGLAPLGELHPLQKAFVEHGAVQCGYCTPGMLMSAKALLDHNPNPTEDEVRLAISGNLCRCTGYAKIAEAIKAASQDCGPWIEMEEANHARRIRIHRQTGAETGCHRQGHRAGHLWPRHEIAPYALRQDSAQ